MSNRMVKLARRPKGMVAREDFTIEDGPVPEPGPGEFRVRIEYISLDPAMRGWMNEGKSYVPPVGIGEVMRGYAAGIVEKSNNPAFKAGDAVQGMFGVQKYAISNGERVVKVDTSQAPLQRWIGGLGMPGWTAYFGLLEVGQPKAGETVVVSAASGAVGSVVGQIAKIKGCRAVGIAGGPDKCRYVTQELGFDACVDYKAGKLAADLKAAAPKGIDVNFENVGGEILDTVLMQMNLFGRIPVCGLISAYNATAVPEGPQEPARRAHPAPQDAGPHRVRLGQPHPGGHRPARRLAQGGQAQDPRGRARGRPRRLPRRAQPALHGRQPRQAGAQGLMLAPGVTLYFVRHGETDWNLAQRYQGQRDIPLNATGRAQARARARAGRSARQRAAALDYVASPLPRARETMEIMRRELGLPPDGYRTDARLREIHYGHWEGELWNELPAIDPEGFAAREADKWGWQPRGGESYRMLSERVALWLGEVAARRRRGRARRRQPRAARPHPAARPAEILSLGVPQDKVLVLKASAHRAGCERESCSPPAEPAAAGPGEALPCDLLSFAPFLADDFLLWLARHALASAASQISLPISQPILLLAAVAGCTNDPANGKRRRPMRRRSSNA